MSKIESREHCTIRWRNLWRENVRIAKQVWGENLSTQFLKTLTTDFQLSVKNGDLQVINGHWYVTHTGLLRLARRKKCRGIHVEAVHSLCDSAANRFVLKATVYPSKSSSGFVGYGDADPSNVSFLGHHELDWPKTPTLAAGSGTGPEIKGHYTNFSRFVC